MSSLTRKLKRQKAKNDGTFLYKKVVARKLGCSVPELNERLKERELNLKKLEDINNGKE